jgi:hypothetical protein
MDLSIHVYEVVKCGFYRRNNHTPAFGSLGDTLASMSRWINNISNRPRILETQTYTTGPDDKLLPSFCFSLLNIGNDYLLTLWNKSQTVGNKYASVPENSTVGAAIVNTVDVPLNNIPGYPTYFWIIPERNLILTVQSERSLRGIAEFTAYMKGFLRTKSRWVVGNATDGDLNTLLSYSRTGSPDDIDNSVEPGFRMALAKDKGEMDFIRNNYHEIRKSVRKATFSALSAREKNQFLNFASKVFGLGGNQTVQPNADANYRIEVDYTPNRQAIESIFRTWNEEEHTDSYDDIGFIFKGETSPRWINRTIVKIEAGLEVRLREDAPMMDPSSLAPALQSNRDGILAQIPEREEIDNND